MRIHADTFATDLLPDRAGDLLFQCIPWESPVPLSGSAFYGYIFDKDTEMVNLYFNSFRHL